MTEIVQQAFESQEDEQRGVDEGIHIEEVVGSCG